jgi:hypothetical protein
MGLDPINTKPPGERGRCVDLAVMAGRDSTLRLSGYEISSGRSVGHRTAFQCGVGCPEVS